eukprot:9813862-Prorocentrum_lima.AAC.1
MTSSLVGSEMCIRDRWRAQMAHRRPRGRARKTGDQGRNAVGNTAAKYAVSYTHLTLPTICSV